MKNTAFYTLLCYAALLHLFSGCTAQKKNSLQDEGLPYHVNLEQCLSTERAVKISDIADTVEYVELKTPENLPITFVMNIVPIDSFWIVHARDGVYKFTNKGEYMKNIGGIGQGPGEYSLVFDIDVDYLRKEILINVPGRFQWYDLDGNYLRMEEKINGFTIWNAGVSDSVLWCCEPVRNKDKYIAFAMDYQNRIIDSIPNPFYGILPRDEGTGGHLAKLYKPFYRYKDTLYLKGKEMNDTIYQLSGRYREPYVVFNMGKYKLPLEYEAWYDFEASQKHGSRYWGFPSVAEDDRYLFLLTQRYAAVDGRKYVHNEDNFRYIVYDKETREGFVTNGEEGTRFTDDILGGPPIWPYWVIGDYYMNVVEWYPLTEEIKKGNYHVSPAFQKQLDGWGDSTNPLVIMCRKKK